MIKDISGERFGRLVAVSMDGLRVKSGGCRLALWRCRCDCGAEPIVDGSSLRSGNTQSCGCLRREVTSKRRATHRSGRSPTHNSWRAAKERCTNPNFNGYSNYGGRGISMCRRWADSFEAFREDMGERPTGLTLDRIDSDGDYEPGNCRWATPREQASHLRTTIVVEHEGKQISLSHFAEIAGIPMGTLYWRVTKGGQTPGEAVRSIKSGERFSRA